MKISYLITFLFCPFHWTEICWCMIEISASVVFGNLRKIFGNVWKMSENVLLAFGIILENLRTSSESDRKSSENREKRRIYSSCQSNIKFISSRHRVISSIYIISQVILAFWLVLAYNLLEDRCTFDFIRLQSFPSVF